MWGWVGTCTEAVQDARCLFQESVQDPGRRDLAGASSPGTLSFAYSLKDSAVEVETDSCSKLTFWVDICFSAKFAALNWALAAISEHNTVNGKHSGVCGVPPPCARTLENQNNSPHTFLWRGLNFTKNGEAM